VVGLVIGQEGDDDVQEVADAQTVQGGDRVRLALA
jgi:hypothetical protein